TDIFAPDGYPLAIPITQAKLPEPGTLKTGRIIGSKSTPIKLTTPKLMSNSAVIKKGSNDGNKTSHHISKPRILASSLGSDTFINKKVMNIVTLANNIVLLTCFNNKSP